MVDRIESGVRAVDRDEEREQMDADERSGELIVEQGDHAVDVAGQAVGVGDQHRGGGVRARNHGSW